MNKKLLELINKQINNELGSAYLYLDFANYFDGKGLTGYANYYKVQCKEEINHALLQYEFVHDSGYCVELNDVSKPNKEYKNIEEILKEGLKAEENVSNDINGIYACSVSDGDYRTMKFLEFFIKEQAEEERNAKDMIDDYKLYGDNSLYELNKKYAERQYKEVDYNEVL